MGGRGAVRISILQNGKEVGGSEGRAPFTPSSGWEPQGSQIPGVLLDIIQEDEGLLKVTNEAAETCNLS